MTKLVILINFLFIILNCLINLLIPIYSIMTLMYLFLEPIEFLNPRPRKRRDTEDDNNDDPDLVVLPRILNPIACMSSGDMLVFHLTINYTGTDLFFFTHDYWFNHDVMIYVLFCFCFFP